ncbi:hypothetical protein [Qipengyuania sp.]|uniref:spike base protein, RCAP_Rcc01079 family n=1 Tax=Qipengyuania sp. TaxID=2004515 RepID=UPI0035C8171B
MTDAFARRADSAEAPSANPYAIVPSDAAPLVATPKALYVGSGGTVVLRTAGGAADVTFANVASGQILPVRAQFVRATGTTAADIVALA